jgi:hypothetical protein
VGGNPVNLVDPSGQQGVERHEGACDGWSGYPRFMCTTLYNDASLGDYGLSAIEEFYRVVVWRNRIQLGWYVAADLLDHYLDGTEGFSPGDIKPGKPYYIYDREWLLSSEKDSEAYNQLISTFVNEYLKPAALNCSPNPIREHLVSDLIDPDGNSEVKGALGKHSIQAYFEAWRYGDDSFFADTKVNFFIDDPYDFHPPLGVPVNQYGIGFVPHQWLFDLADAHQAAEFNTYVVWYEHLSIKGSVNTIMYRVDRIFP